MHVEKLSDGVRIHSPHGGYTNVAKAYRTWLESMQDDPQQRGAYFSDDPLDPWYWIKRKDSASSKVDSFRMATLAVLERRFPQNADHEIRLGHSGGGTLSAREIHERSIGHRLISGYAAVFHDSRIAGTEYQLAEGLKERIAPTAFNRALRENQDTVALVNHDPSLLLGRIASKTLKLSIDKRGLAYEVSPPQTTVAADLIESIDRGDVAGSSFGFRVTKQSFTKGASCDYRTIEDCDLYDISPVTMPAYRGTSAYMSSASRHDAAAVARRLRLVEINA